MKTHNTFKSQLYETYQQSEALLNINHILSLLRLCSLADSLQLYPGVLLQKVDLLDTLSNKLAYPGCMMVEVGRTRLQLNHPLVIVLHQYEPVEMIYHQHNTQHSP